MKAQLKLQLGALRQVEDTTESGADRLSLSLDFGDVDLELQLARTVGGGVEVPAAWNKLHEALSELATLAAEHRQAPR